MSSPVVVKILAGVVGTVGFAILFRLKPLHWLFAGIDGLLTCVAYFAFMALFDNILASNIFAAFVCAFFAEILARFAKAPATVFVLPGIIALVPGSTLYYSMSNLLNENYIEAGHNLLLTVEVAIALGGGIIAASVLRIIVFKVYDRIKMKINH